MPLSYLPPRSWFALLVFSGILGIIAWLPSPYRLHNDGGELIVERAWFEDPTAQLSWEDVRTRPHAVFSSSLLKGFTGSAVWVRLRLKPSAPAAGAGHGWAPEPIILTLGPTFLEHLELFDTLEPQSERRVGGIAHEPGAAAFPSRHHTFALPASTSPRDVWVRVATRGSLLLSASARIRSDAVRRERRDDLLVATGLAVVFGMLALGFFEWRAFQEPIVQAFVLVEAGMLTYTLAYVGYLRLLLDGLVTGHAAVFIHYGFTQFAVLGVVHFFAVAMAEYEPPPRGLTVLRWTRAVPCVGACAAAAGYVREATQLSLLTLMAVVWLAAALAMRGRVWSTEPRGVDSRHLSRPALLAGLGFAAAGVTTWVAVMFGVFESRVAGGSGELAPPLLAPGVALLAVFAILRSRARGLNQVNLDLQVNLRVAERQVELERQHRKQQADFLTMLSHELKTPLAVLRMVIGYHSPTPAMRQQAEKAILGMAGIVEMCTHVEQLESATAALRDATCSIGDELAVVRSEILDNTRLAVEYDDDLPLVTADPKMVRVILRNLMDNALKYAAAGTTVGVSAAARVRDAALGVCVTVSNQPGSAGRPDASMVFRKYYRSPGAHRHTGSGLGLYLASQLASRMGGDLRYVPTRDSVEFVLWLPA